MRTAFGPAGQRSTALVLAALATLAMGTMAATPAGASSADARSCVSRGECRQVHRGMTQAPVHAMFDSAGVRGEASTATQRLVRIRGKSASRHVLGDASRAFTSVALERTP